MIILTCLIIYLVSISLSRSLEIKNVKLARRVKILSLIPVVNTILAILIWTSLFIIMTFLLIASPFLFISVKLEEFREAKEKKIARMSIGDKRKLKIKKII